jgi:Uma2 family endonuclease
MVATKTRFTFADLLAQPPGEEKVYEVLGGELVVWTAPNEKHGTAVLNGLRCLLAAEDAGYGRVHTAPRAVAFDYQDRGVEAEDVTHPDMLFVRREREEILGEQCIEAAPDLVVEVLSPTTRRDDLPGGRKWAIYERYGVPFYWIIDPDARTVAAYAWSGGRYGEPRVLRPGDTLDCPLFPDITWPVAALFARLPEAQ